MEPLLAAAKGADVLVTTGGVSVGDRDLLSRRGEEFGLEVDFWKIAMRPGKPLLFGRLAETPLLALPGNPVSVLVCAFLFLGPLLARLSGESEPDQQWQRAQLDRALPINDWRESYLRGHCRITETGNLAVAAVDEQDSSMLAVMARSNCLIRRAANAEALSEGCDVDITLFSKALFSF
jgi:molybdopterin molybdotransferase